MNFKFISFHLYGFINCNFIYIKFYLKKIENISKDYFLDLLISLIMYFKKLLNIIL